MIKTQGTDQFANVHCGLRDKAGNLWFGTTGEGVFRYDGKLFINFTTKEGLNNNTVWSMVEDGAGNIWFGTDDGLCRYDGRTIFRVPISVASGGDFLRSSSLERKPSAKNAVWSVMRAKDGKLWFGTSEGVYCYNVASFARFLDDDNLINGSGLSLKSVQCMLEDKQGTIWFGSGPLAFEGVCRFDGTSISSSKPGGEKWIRHLLEDRGGNIWLGTRNQGAWRYDGTAFSPFRMKEGIGSPVLVDGAGNVWFSGGENDNGYGGDGGIWRYDGKSFKNFSTKDGLGDYSVWCMVDDSAGNIWVGTRNIGLYRYDGTTFTCFSE